MGTPIKIVKKGWGSERWLYNTDRLCVKQLIIYPGKRCSMHFHKDKQEIFYVLKGRVVIDTMDTSTAKIASYLLYEGEHILIDPLVPHQIFSADTAPVIILESSTHHEDSDSYRILPGDSQNESQGN